MPGLTIILALSLVVQFVIERIKIIDLPEKVKKWLIPILSLIVALAVTISCQIGLLLILGIVVNPPLVDWIITGVIISGGSTLVNELIKALQGIKETLQNSKDTGQDKR